MLSLLCTASLTSLFFFFFFCLLRNSPFPKCGAATSSPCTVPSLWRDTVPPPPSSPAKSACARSRATSRFCRSTRPWPRWGFAAAGGEEGACFAFLLNLYVTFPECVSTDSRASSPEFAFCINRARRTLFLSFILHRFMLNADNINPDVCQVYCIYFFNLYSFRGTHVPANNLLHIHMHQHLGAAHCNNSLLSATE